MLSEKVGPTFVLQQVGLCPTCTSPTRADTTSATVGERVELHRRSTGPSFVEVFKRSEKVSMLESGRLVGRRRGSEIAKLP
jgi:hypothetical protein